LKMKPTESLTTATLLTSISWIKLRLKRSLGSISIKEVLYQATLSELLTLKELTLRHVAVLTVITLLKLDGLDYLRPKEYQTVLSDFTMLLKRELFKFLMKSIKS